MKKILYSLLACFTFFLIFSVNVSAASYKAGGECGKDLKWSLDYNGNLVIYGEGEMTNFGFWDYNSKGWRDYSSEIKTVTVEKGATTIGRSAFDSCKNLTTVQLPTTLKIIESDAFRKCTSLSKINLPKGLQELGSHTFYGCSSLTSIQIPATLTNLGCRGYGQGTFSESGLKTITIPANVKKMASYCFKNCPNLTAVSINGTNLAVEYEAFYDCKKLTTVKMGSGVTSIKDKAFWGCSMLRDVTIGNNVTSIGDGAFKNCTMLKEIVIPDKVTTIDSSEYYATFGECPALEKVTLGKGLIKLGNYAFLNDKSLKEVYFCGDAPTFGGNYIFKGCGNITAYYPKNSKTWDRSNMTGQGAVRVDWQSWTIPLGYFTPTLKSVGAGAKGVTVTWNRLANANGYEVWRSVGNGTLTKVKTISSGSTVTWTDTGVSNGKRYTYRIYAINGTQKSKISNARFLYYLTKNTISAAKSGSSFNVKWKANSAATGYQIQYAKNNKFTSGKKVTVKGRNVTSRKVSPGFKGNCYIRIRTYKTVDGKTYCSAWSNVKAVKF